MKKIYLIRANKTKYGGAENYLSRLADEFQNNGIDFELKNSIFPKFLPSWIRALLFNLQVCLTKGEKFYFSLERITCPDIYRAGDGVHRVFLKTKKRKLNLLNPVYLYLEKRCFYSAKKIIANSYMVKNQIINTYNMQKDKIEVIYNGINIKPLVDTQSIKKEFDLTDEKIVLYVGSGFERKGVKEALEIVSKLQTKVKFIVVGKDKKINYYKNLAKSLDVDAIFTGPRSDVDKFYSLADIFLFPTPDEGYGNVMMEAISHGIIVLAFDNTAISNFGEMGFHIHLVEDGSLEALQERLLFIANNIEEEKRLAQENVAKARKVFSPKREALQYIDLLL